MRCGDWCWESCGSKSAVSPLICGRLSPAAQEIRIWGSANNSARNRSASLCRAWISVRRRASFRAARTRCRISRIAATTEKPSNAKAVVSAAISWWFISKKVVMASSKGKSPAFAGVAETTAVTPRAIRPLRASEVHDSRVRRIAAITPDMVCPKPHDYTPGASPAVRESYDNIPNGSQRVRVQTVNAKSGREKSGAKFFERFLMKVNPLFYGDGCLQRSAPG